MKILVCIAKVPDTTTKISFTEDNTKFNENGVQWIINPADEWYALVRALEIKETAGGQVSVINVGVPENDAILRKALAVGADDAIRINSTANSALSVAKEIKSFAHDQGYDLILCGKETIDFNGSMMPAMLAELMDMEYFSSCSKLDMEGGEAKLQLDIEGGVEIVTCPTPLVVSCAKGMAEARIPNMRGIMAARTKPLQVVEGQNPEELATVKQFEEPQAKSAVKLVDPENMDELVRLLHEEAKSI